ncbi:Fic family protein [Methanoplanus endosymbiosus]|uniref:Fic family protein n=1 Tax=Methanoplanus endosymbiosus TaxID=33865 RepID=A0A9E7PR50_9EURY|nr:Fic family protein [Methanoplanus endosymbiosus]UUX93381.1 Fic family protein [Methanoplanus endosymbiosus]
MAKKPAVIKNIPELRRRFYKSARHKESLLALIAEAEVTEQVYNSNAIENSTLTFEETDKILLEIDPGRYILVREHFEAVNLAEVIRYINENAKKEELTPEIVLKLHEMLLSDIRDDIKGRFRKTGEWVRVGGHIGLDPDQIMTAIEEMFAHYYATSEENIIRRIAKLHLTFEYIHPFIDGNGRIGRVIINYLLIREGYVPITITFTDRSLYYDAFEEFESSGKTSVMEAIIGKALTNSYHKRLTYLEGMEIVSLREYSRRFNISHSNLINKANRQTIPAFLEKGRWKIGIPAEKQK